jgi:hypothetical protein
MTDSIRTYQVCRDKRRQDRSYYQQLKLSHLSYIIQWRYDKAREICSGPGSLNRFSASLSGVSAGG